jgi:hypothetical protein
LKLQPLSIRDEKRRVEWPRKRTPLEERDGQERPWGDSEALGSMGLGSKEECELKPARVWRKCV